MLGLWAVLSAQDVFPTGTVPSPREVAVAFGQEVASGRLVRDIIASLFRVAWGFTLGVIVAVPLGLVVGRSAATRDALMPWINFFRSLSPIAWIPFAIMWFGIGSPPAIFVIFMAVWTTVALATAAAAAAVPRIYYRVAEDMEMSRSEVLFRVTLPAILPQLMTSLRVAVGVAWLVVVAAEMMGADSGLGYVILDARNGQRMDLVVVGMIVIGVIGITIDVLFARLQKLPIVRWGFER